MKRKIRWQGLALVLVLGIGLLLPLAGCRQSGEQGQSQTRDEGSQEAERTPAPTQSEPETGEKLTVFYDEGVLNTFLMNFMMLYPDLNVEYIMTEPGDERFQEALQRYGEPDVILLSNSGGARSAKMAQWYQDGTIANLNDFYLQDDTVDPNLYFPGTFELCKAEEDLYAIPLAVTVSFLTVRENQWVGSEFENLGYEYTGRDVLTALMKELEKQRDEDEFFISESMGDPIELLYRMGGIHKEGNEIIADEETYQQAYDLCYQVIADRMEVRGYYNENAQGAFGAGYSSFTGIDPRLYNGKFLVSAWGYGSLKSAFPLAYTYAKSANIYEGGQDTHAIWYPSLENGKSYGAEATIFGMVGGNSAHQQEAYELLRKLMDTPSDLWEQAGSLQSVTYCPIHRGNALQMMESLDQETEPIKVMDAIGQNQAYTMDRQSLSEEEKAELTAVINGISFLYYEDAIWEEAVNMFFRYYDAKVTDYQYCYQETMELMNPESDRWQAVDIESIEADEPEESESE